MHVAAEILLKNQDLIERFLDLATAQDSISDSRHRWFYSLISYDRVVKLQFLITREDLHQEVMSHVLTLFRNTKLSEKEFSNYLKQSIGWYLRDILEQLEASKSALEAYCEPEVVDYMNPSNYDIRWLISNTDDVLSNYERYILYLSVYKCYTIKQICKIVYQERSTIRKDIRKTISKLRNYYAIT